MASSAVVRNHEERISFLPTERLIAEGPWTQSQQRLLEVLQHKEYRYASMAKICRLAGYAGTSPWHQAMKDDRFVAAAQALGVKRSHDDLPRWQQRLLEVVQHSENRTISGAEICRRAGYKDTCPWQRAIKNERFVAELESLDVPIRKQHLPSHLAVEPATNINEELAKDAWDIRRFKHDYLLKVNYLGPPATTISFAF